MTPTFTERLREIINIIRENEKKYWTDRNFEEGYITDIKSLMKEVVGEDKIVGCTYGSTGNQKIGYNNRAKEIKERIER